MTTYPATEAGLMQALTDLGNTANHVADTLLAAGYQGEPRCERTCPVAMYLSARFPGLRVRVWQDEGYLSAELHDGERTVAVAPPRAVVEFVVGFDSGNRWTDLIGADEVAA